MIRAMRSIRARLLAGLLALVAATTIAAGAVTYRRLLAETSTLLDYQLRQMALSLRDQAAFGPGLQLPSRASGSEYIVQIWDPFGTLHYLSSPDLASQAGLPIIPRAILGYADMMLAGRRWRVYSLDTVWGVIQVAQPWSVRDQLAREAALRVVAPLLLLLLAMAAAVVWIVGRGLAPLKRRAGAARRDRAPHRGAESPARAPQRSVRQAARLCRRRGPRAALAAHGAVVAIATARPRPRRGGAERGARTARRRHRARDSSRQPAAHARAAGARGCGIAARACGARRLRAPGDRRRASARGAAGRRALSLCRSGRCIRSLRPGQRGRRPRRAPHPDPQSRGQRRAPRPRAGACDGPHRTSG